MLIRDEDEGDIPATRAVVTEAMRLLPQSSGTEAAIVERLRREKSLCLSLVAQAGGEVVGYLAASDARIGTSSGWGLIGPVAVLPMHHRQGIGSALMNEAIGRLKAADYQGATLVGDPGYYSRFGFRSFTGLRAGDCPPRFVQALPFGTGEPKGELIHHAAFGLTREA